MPEKYQFTHEIEKAMREYTSQLGPGTHYGHGKVSSLSERAHFTSGERLRQDWYERLQERPDKPFCRPEGSSTLSWTPSDIGTLPSLGGLRVPLPGILIERALGESKLLSEVVPP